MHNKDLTSESTCTECFVNIIPARIVSHCVYLVFLTIQSVINFITLILSIQTFKLNSNNTQDYAHNGHTMKCNEYLTVTKIKDKYLCLLLLLLVTTPKIISYTFLKISFIKILQFVHQHHLIRNF